MSEHWATKIKRDHNNLKQNMALQSLANYIVLTMSESQVDALVPHLQDTTKQVHVEIYVTDREKREGE